MAHGIIVWLTFVLLPFLVLLLPQEHNLSKVLLGCFGTLFLFGSLLLILTYRGSPFGSVHGILGVSVVSASAIAGLIILSIQQKKDGLPSCPQPEKAYSLIPQIIFGIVWAAALVNIHFGIDKYSEKYPDAHDATFLHSVHYMTIIILILCKLIHSVRYIPERVPIPVADEQQDVAEDFTHSIPLKVYPSENSNNPIPSISQRASNEVDVSEDEDKSLQSPPDYESLQQGTSRLLNLRPSASDDELYRRAGSSLSRDTLISSMGDLGNSQ